MRTYWQLDRSILNVLFEDDPDRSRGKALPQFVDKKRSSVHAGVQPIFLDGLQRQFTKLVRPVLRAKQKGLIDYCVAVEQKQQSQEKEKDENGKMNCAIHSGSKNFGLCLTAVRLKHSDP
jgi:hypothetical protein